MKRLWSKGFCICIICWVAGVFSGCSDSDGTSGPSAQIAVMVTGNLESRIVPRDVSLDGETVSLGGLARIAAAAGDLRGTVDGAPAALRGRRYTGFLLLHV